MNTLLYCGGAATGERTALKPSKFNGLSLSLCCLLSLAPFGHTPSLSAHRPLSGSKDVTLSGNTEMQLSPVLSPPSSRVLSARALKDLAQTNGSPEKSGPDVNSFCFFNCNDGASEFLLRLLAFVYKRFCIRTP